VEQVMAVTVIDGEEFTVNLEVDSKCGLDRVLNMALVEFENQGIETAIDNICIF
jgi:hypothetical protein